MELRKIDLVFKIGRETYVVIEFDGAVTREAIEKLITILEIEKEVYPSEDETLKQP